MRGEFQHARVSPAVAGEIDAETRDAIADHGNVDLARILHAAVERDQRLRLGAEQRGRQIVGKHDVAVDHHQRRRERRAREPQRCVDAGDVEERIEHDLAAGDLRRDELGAVAEDDANVRCGVVSADLAEQAADQRLAVDLDQALGQLRRRADLAPGSGRRARERAPRPHPLAHAGGEDQVAHARQSGSKSARLLNAAGR